MNKSKHFIFAVMATAIVFLIFGSRTASAQATNKGIFNATPTPTNTPTEDTDISPAQAAVLSEASQPAYKL